MLSGILNSPKAIQTNIAIIRAFIALRQYSLSFAGLAEKIRTHEKELESTGRAQ